MTSSRDSSGREMTTRRDDFNGLALAEVLGARCLSVTEGRTVTLLEGRPEHCNPDGALTGASIAAVIDLAAGFAVAATTLEEDYAATTDLTIHFVHAARHLPLTLTAEVIRRGSRNCFVRLEGVDRRGEPCVVATGTWAIFPGGRHRARMLRAEVEDGVPS